MIESLYGGLLVAALVLNGMAITAGGVGFFALLRPLRRPVVLAMVALDVVALPLVVLGVAALLGVDDVLRATLIIVAASSAGPIGIPLTRIVRGDVALAVSLVGSLGLLNLVSVPLVTGLLLPASIRLPLWSTMSGLVMLVALPLVLGRVWIRIAAWRRWPEPQAWVVRVRRLSTVLLVSALLLALLLEPRSLLAALAGPMTLAALLVTAGVGGVAALAGRTRAERSTFWIVLNARAMGLALALASLQLADVEGLRANLIAYALITQNLPLVVSFAAARLQAPTREAAP